MPDRRRQVPPGSREEAQMAASLIYGMLYSLLMGFGDLIKEKFNYQGVELIPGDEADKRANIHFTGVRIRMASGSYRVIVEREKS